MSAATGEQHTGQVERKRWALRLTALTICCICVYGITLAYRWAEPSQSALNAVTHIIVPTSTTMSLENVQYSRSADGYINWSVHAGRIDLTGTPTGLAEGGLQQAAITGIRDGALYSPPAHRPVSTPGGAAPAEKPYATFSADQGRYVVGEIDALPSDLRPLYSVLWQFRLMGNVHLTTRQGEQLNAPSLTVMELRSWHGGIQERRIVCTEGADLTGGKVAIHANSVRFDPTGPKRVVECIGGVRGTLLEKNKREKNKREKDRTDTVQTESAFWSLEDRTLNCPNTAAGVWNGNPFTAGNMSIDTRKQTYQFTNLQMQLQHSIRSKLPLP